MKRFITAKEVAEECGVSMSKAYSIIRKMNDELSADGYLVIAGKVPIGYFNKKVYGTVNEE